MATITKLHGQWLIYWGSAIDPKILLLLFFICFGDDNATTGNLSTNSLLLEINKLRETNLIWRYFIYKFFIFADMICQHDMEYQCGSGCDQTCESYNKPCTKPSTYNCFCKGNKVLKNGRCVSPVDCRLYLSYLILIVH